MKPSLILGSLFASSVLATDRRGDPRDVTNAIYKNPTASVDDRVSDLLWRMTIQEKTAQLVQGDIQNWLNMTDNTLNSTGLAWTMTTRAGTFYVGYPPVEWDWLSGGIKKAQDYLMKNTTLGIPAIVQTEGIHGLLAINATIFNSPIGQACSFNPALIEKMGNVIAQESLALGINQMFAPLADLARELRYGRVEECYGEDAYLAGEMAYSYVKGVQDKNVSAMVKHFAGFGTPEQGINTAPVHGGERELRTTYLPPFKRAIIDAGAWAIMTAYHAYDGIPAVADYHLLTEILRKEWGYKYWTMSDAGATDRLCAAFKMCSAKPIDKTAIVKYALPAGNDVEMGGGSYSFDTIPDIVAKGGISMKDVDTAVSRILKAKFAMGLFENPYTGIAADKASSVIHTPENIALARQLDTESIVLLENKAATLPLKKSANVAVIGPMAHGYMNYGDYVVFKSQFRGITPLDGIRAASSGKVTYAQGCSRWSNDDSGFASAIAAASAADVAIVIVGTWSRDQNELWQGLNATTGEHVDISSLNLVGAMPRLVAAIINTGKPTVVVFSSGKPVTEAWISTNASALVQQFYPSEQGGNALADVLYGNYNPSGKLSVGFPYDVGTLPIYYDFLNSARSVDVGKIYDNGTLQFGHQYVLNSPEPLYEFGYGKSYSTFVYGNVTADRTVAGKKDTVTFSVSVTNNSTRDGTEVVQLYVSDVIASVAVPNIALKGFQKVQIGAGKTEIVKIAVGVAELGVWDVRMKYVVEAGDFLVQVGSSSRDLRTKMMFAVE